MGAAWLCSQPDGFLRTCPHWEGDLSQAGVGGWSPAAFTRGQEVILVGSLEGGSSPPRALTAVPLPPRTMQARSPQLHTVLRRT